MGLKKRLGSMTLAGGAGVSEKMYVWAPGVAGTQQEEAWHTQQQSWA